MILLKDILYIDNPYKSGPVFIGMEKEATLEELEESADLYRREFMENHTSKASEIRLYFSFMQFRQRALQIDNTQENLESYQKAKKDYDALFNYKKSA